MAASGEERLGGGGIEHKGKRTHGHGQQCGEVKGGKWQWKKYNKNKFLKEKSKSFKF